MRRFYCFNDPVTVESHISQIKTVEDLIQLAFDIRHVDCNLVDFRIGIDGVWALDYAKGHGPFHRHIFIREDVGITPTDSECNSYSLLSWQP